MNTFKQTPQPETQSLALQNAWVFWTMHKEHKKKDHTHRDTANPNPNASTASEAADPILNSAASAPPASTTTGPGPSVQPAASSSGGGGSANYSDAIIKLCTFSSIDQFWMGYSHLKRPHELPTASDLFLFKEGLRPTWEDQPTGGKWIVRLKKGLASRYWENLVLALIGEQFDVGSEICGAVISMRHQEDILSVWNQNAESGRVNLKIRDTLKKVLNLPSNCIMEYKAHQASITDQSSYRNTALFL
ncbi:translation initiation factor eIF 4e-like domain-containing protein [Chytriomyces sp. MP71]|nr:translation initiation factor eIF 4e-like domain-containing protein [Chytriomyces sp. MP71]